MLEHLKFPDAQKALAEKIATDHPRLAADYKARGVDLADLLSQVVPLVIRELNPEIKAELAKQADA